MKTLLSPVLIVLAIIIGYFYIYPLFNHVEQLSTKREESKVLLNSIENMETRLTEVEQEYGSFSAHERAILTRLIPRTVTETDLIHDLTAIAAAHNLEIVEVEFASEDEDAQQTQTIGGEEAEGEEVVVEKPFKKWDATVTVKGNYNGFKQFVSDIGRNIRISDISEIEITEAAEGENAVNSYKVNTVVYSIE